MNLFIMVFIAMLTIHPAFSQKSKSNTSSENFNARQVTYVCTMHPDVKADKPSKCPKCNMDLVGSTEIHKKSDVPNTYSCSRHPEVTSDHPGFCPLCKEKLVIDRKGSKQVSKTYTCSMHPDVTSNKPGKCPKCDMDLTEVKSGSKAKKDSL